MESATLGHAEHAPSVAGLRLLIAEDHHLVREGLKLALREIDAGATLFEAETLKAAVQVCQSSAVDLVLLDLSMPDSEGITALDVFVGHCPDARIVIVSATYDMQSVRAALSKGVLGYIPKVARRSALLAALRFVLDGGIYVPPEALMESRPESARVASAPSLAAGTSPQYASTRQMALTTRQLEVLGELLQGKSNKQICRELNLAMGTVKGHVAAILAFLGVTSRAEAILAARRLGLHLPE